MLKLFKLKGYVIVTDWYGNAKYNRLLITTDQEGLDEIKANPLQDYTRFGAQSVDYAFFNVYCIDIEETDEYIRETRWREPIDTIESGDISCVDRVGGYKFLVEIGFEEPVSIEYQA